MANINESYSKDRSILGEVVPLDTPYTVVIDSSEVCNFKCKYCFRSEPPNSLWGLCKKNNIMEWTTFIKIVDQLKYFPRDIKRISLSGHGEPLCNKLVPDMVKYIKKIGFKSKIDIHTNAYLLDEDYIEKLVKSKIDKIVISIQGLDDVAYLNTCGVQINFDKFYNNLVMLFKNKKNTEIYIKTVDIAVVNQEEKFYKLFGGISDNIFIEKVVPLFKGLDYDNIISEKNFFYNKFSKAFEEQECCPQAFYELFIFPEGEVYPCAQSDAPVLLGNIHNSTLMEIWNNEKRKELLKLHLTKGRRSHEKCKDCYVPQNTITSTKDIIDPYREEILKRMRLIYDDK